jgi:hypothetical protein
VRLCLRQYSRATLRANSISRLVVLLFVGGLMNVAWIGAIPLFVLLKKTVPWAVG